MNIIRKFKRLKAGIFNEEQAALSSIPKSRLAGIHALPVELWSLIIDFVLVDKLGSSYLQCRELLDILEYRLVSRVFDREVRHALHQHLLLSQLPYIGFVRAFIHNERLPNKKKDLPITLLASAICNSSRPSGSSRRHIRTPRIANRVRNCTTIATHIATTSGSLPFHVTHSARTLMQSFCNAASTSAYCQEYMFMPTQYDARFKSCAEGDMYLEAALLVANGYPIEEVKIWMVRLAKEGKLMRYRKNSGLGVGGCSRGWGMCGQEHVYG
ncbi:Nn.00g095880.m01.CDS01 [Neocucurbitaria sp. VM-36]